MRYRSVEFSKDGESTPTISLWKCCKIRWIWRVSSGLRAQALGMEGVIQCRLQAGFFVSAQSFCPSEVASQVVAGSNTYLL
jgi:hypothetical protein